MIKSDSPEILQPPAVVESSGGAAGETNGFAQSPCTWRPKVRVTSDYDSDSSMFFNRISCKLFDNLLKCKLSFQNDSKGEILEPQLAFTSKYLSLHYDVEQNNALAKASVDVGAGIQLKAAHDFKVFTIVECFEILIVFFNPFLARSVTLDKHKPFKVWFLLLFLLEFGLIYLRN